MKGFHFIVAVSGECCARSHLWSVSVIAATKEKAVEKLRRQVTRAGYEPSEFIQLERPACRDVEEFP